MGFMRIKQRTILMHSIPLIAVGTEDFLLGGWMNNMVGIAWVIILEFCVSRIVTFFLFFLNEVPHEFFLGSENHDYADAPQGV